MKRIIVILVIQIIKCNMFGFTIKVVICDYKNQKMIYEVLQLETKDDIFDKYEVKETQFKIHLSKDID